jgi:large conductance mechanosensitive channel
VGGFRKFLMRGNVIDLAVGIVIGAAFSGVVSSFVAAFFTPVIGLLTGASGDFAKATAKVAGVDFPYGAFVTALLSFILIAFAVYFFVVVPMNRISARFQPHEDVTVPKRECPECLSSVPAAARRCAFCTTVLPEPREAQPRDPERTMA